MKSGTGATMAKRRDGARGFDRRAVELMKIAILEERIEVVDRAGFYEARIPGRAERVFSRNRTTAIERASKWKPRKYVAKEEIYEETF